MLAACVPGAFGGWLLLLRDFGTWRLGDVLEFAIGYAEHGYPLHERIRATIELNEELLASWPGSRDLYLPAPEAGELFRNPALAATYRRIVEESRGGSREEEIERARLAYYEGFVAEEIDRFSAAEGGLLTGADMAAWQATIEPVATFEYRGLTVCKTQPVGGGPGRSPAARPARRASTSPSSRPQSSSTSSSSAGSSRSPTATRSTATPRTCRSSALLSTGYNDERRALVGEDASAEYRPGTRPAPALRRRRGHGRLRRAGPRHRASRHRRPLREHDLGDAERRLAAELAGDPRARLAARNAGADVLARGRACVVASPGHAPAHDALSRARAARRRARTSRGARPAATSRSSGRCTRSSATSISG